MTRRAKIAFRTAAVLGLLQLIQAQRASAQAPPDSTDAAHPLSPKSHIVTRSQLPSNVVEAIAKSDAVIVSSSIKVGATAAAVETPSVIPPAAPTVTLNPGQFVAASIAGPIVRVNKIETGGLNESVFLKSFLALPVRVVGLATDLDVVYLRPAYLPKGALRYTPSISMFRGEFGIGLEDSVRTTEQRELPGGFPFQFGGDADSVAPRDLKVTHTNAPLSTVTVLARNPSDSLLVRIITAADVRGTSIWIPTVPALVFGLLPGTAQGLGLQRIPVTVSMLGTRRAAPVTVKLSTDRGSIEPDTIIVGPGKNATVSWRTEGVGVATIQARATGVDEGSGTVRFVFPFVFLIAAMLGGAAGAAIKAFQNSAPPARPIGAAVGIGMLAGVVAAILYYAIGVSVVKIHVNVPFFNEAAVFSFGFLAGLLGIRLAGSESRP